MRRPLSLSQQRPIVYAVCRDYVGKINIIQRWMDYYISHSTALANNLTATSYLSHLMIYFFFHYVGFQTRNLIWVCFGVNQSSSSTISLKFSLPVFAAIFLPLI